MRFVFCRGKEFFSVFALFFMLDLDDGLSGHLYQSGTQCSHFSVGVCCFLKQSSCFWSTLLKTCRRISSYSLILNMRLKKLSEHTSFSRITLNMCIYITPLSVNANCTIVTRDVFLQRSVFLLCTRWCDSSRSLCLLLLCSGISHPPPGGCNVTLHQHSYSLFVCEMAEVFTIELLYYNISLLTEICIE